MCGRADSTKNRRNTARDGGTAAEWQSTMNPATMRHPLGASCVGARPKWLSASTKKWCRGTRIPASSACAYTQTAPRGGDELARRSPAGRAVYWSSEMTYFLHTASTWPCVRKTERGSSSDDGSSTPAASSSGSEVVTL